jgi:hypothetical protein
LELYSRVRYLRQKAFSRYGVKEACKSFSTSHEIALRSATTKQR